MTDPEFRTSSRCSKGACVEVAPLPGGRGAVVRDGKEKDGPQLSFGSQAWNRFIASIKASKLG